MRSNRPGPRRYRPPLPRVKYPRITDRYGEPNNGEPKTMAGQKAQYRLAVAVGDGKLVGITGLWLPDNKGSVAMQAKTQSKYIKDAVKAMAAACREGEDVRFVIFKNDLNKDGSKNTSKARDDGPKGSGFADDGMDVGDEEPVTEPHSGGPDLDDDIPF